MKRMKRKAIAIAAGLLAVCSVALTGCQSKLAPADQSVGALYELFVKSNAAPMKDLMGFASEDDVKTALIEGSAEEDIVSELKATFTSAGIEVSDEEAQEMTAIFQGLFDKLDYTTEITDESKDEVTVLLKVKSYSMTDMQNIMVEIVNDKQAGMDQETMMKVLSGDEEAVQQYEAMMQEVMKEYIMKLGDLEPMDEMSELTIKCQRVKIEVSGKEKLAWMPQDLNTFSESVSNAVFK